MKAFLTSAALGLTAVGSLVAYAKTSAEMQEEMKKCAVCKVMAAEPALMDNTTFECHKIEAGMLCMVSVPKDLKKLFDDVHKKMMAEAAKLEQNPDQTVELCGFCKSMGELAKAGAKQEPVDTSTGAIFLVTATDPTVVAKIHAAADQAIAEQKPAEVAAQ